MLGDRFKRAVNISSLERQQKAPTQFRKGGRGLGWLLLLGSLLMVGRGVALAEAQLEVGTSTTLSPQAAPPVLPPPPCGSPTNFRGYRSRTNCRYAPFPDGRTGAGGGVRSAN